jgi:glycosyltransferase involved in cell wall biosynthesis
MPMPTQRLVVAQVVAGLDPTHGGPSYSVPRLCAALGDAGAEVTLFSVAGKGQGASDGNGPGYRDRSFRWDFASAPLLRELRLSSGLAAALRSDISGVQVLHNHGLWLIPNVESGWAARSSETPYVVSPRGMLASAALAFSNFKKRAFWTCLQGAVLRRASCLHVTSDAEYHDVRAFGLTNPVAIIPNGIDVPEPVVLPHEPSGRRTILSLGRIHPKKGLERLVRAWATIERDHPACWLRIAGPPEDGHDAMLRALGESLGVARLSIEPPIYGEQRTAAYRDADLFVLPTLNENFGVTVAEALAAGTPVVATDGAPWPALEPEGCGWWIAQGVEPLAAILDRALAMPRERLKAMGAKGRDWMIRDFSWDRVAREMMATYRWLIDRGDPPASVRLV